MENLMTYEEMLTANPQMLRTTPLDEATKAALREWFGLRKVCDNTNFRRFYLRAINLWYDQYKELLRVQSAEYDPMVSQYVERWVVADTQHSTTTTGSDESTRTPRSGTQTTATTTRTPNLTDNNNSVTSSSTSATTHDETSGSGSTSSTDNSTDDRETSNVNSSLAATLPDSSTYAAGVTGGHMPGADGLDWTYADSQTGSKSDGTDNNTHQATSSGTSSTSSESDGSSSTTGNIGVQGTHSLTGTDQTQTTTSVTGTGTDITVQSTSGSESGTGRNSTREISTGRGEAPQDMLNRSIDFILRSNAFLFLLGKLDNCFLANYEI